MAAISFIFLVGIIVNNAQQSMNRILFDKNSDLTGKQCLDGTPAGFFYSPPPSGSSDLWVIYLEGGGDCHDEKSCKQRAQTAKGSSSYWPTTYNPTGSILSNDPTSNPDFYTGHHIYAPYCNGDVWSGKRTQPSTNPDTWGLYFSGHLVFTNIINYLSSTKINGNNETLLDAKYILLTGASAGGMGTFVNIHWLYTNISTDITIKAAPVAGWFFPGNTTDQTDAMMPPNDFPHWTAGQTGGEGHNDSINVLWDSYYTPDCAQALGTKNAWHCGSVHNLWPFLKDIPIFVLENKYDKNQIEAQMLMPSNTVNKETEGYVAYYGGDMDRSILGQVVDQQDSKNGLFYPSCFDHGIKVCGSPKQSTIINGYNATELLGDWFWERNKLPHFVYDTCNNATDGLPCNPTCDPYPPN